RVRWAAARQSRVDAAQDEKRCRAYRIHFYDAVTARQAASICEDGIHRQRDLDLLDSEIDAFNSLIAAQCGGECTHGGGGLCRMIARFRSFPPITPTGTVPVSGSSNAPPPATDSPCRASTRALICRATLSWAASCTTRPPPRTLRARR